MCFVKLFIMWIWLLFASGPDDTCWEGGTFSLKIEYSEEYPNEPPVVHFNSKMFHPNGEFECNFHFYFHS